MRPQKRPTHLHWISTGALTLMMTSGCSVLSSSGAIGPSDAEVKQAYEQGNQTYLSDTCAKAKKRPQGGLFGLPATESEEQACKYAKELQSTNHEDGLTADLAAYQSELTCENVIETYAAYEEKSERTDNTAVAYESAGLKLAECGDYQTLITELIPHKERWGAEIVYKIGETDPELAAHFAAFAEGNTFSFDGSYQAAKAIANWLVNQPTIDNCTAYLQGLESTYQNTLDIFVNFHGLAKCKPAGAKIASLLSSENDLLRHSACRALGRIGDTAHIKKLGVVAETDSAYTTDGLVKTYYVRDECQDAIGKIKLAE